MPKLGVIILAAGSSSRMGQPKQLLKINGETLIRKTIKTAQSFLSSPNPIIVVLGSAFEKINSNIADLECQIVQNENWQKGMSTSLRVGIKELQEIAPATESVLILLCDQPHINTSYLKSLVERFNPDEYKAIASFYNHIKGVPAVFDFLTLSKFSEENGDFGARQLLKKLDDKNQLAMLPFPEGAVDLDTLDDYERFVKSIL